MEFSGAKLAVFLGDDLLVIKRDNKPDIPYPGHWDLPGGGREGDETPLECALRETNEEVSLSIPPTQINWSRCYERARGRVWFFVTCQPASLVSQVQLGSEGQCWRLMEPEKYCRDSLAVPHFVDQIQAFLAHRAAADPS